MEAKDSPVKDCIDVDGLLLPYWYGADSVKRAMRYRPQEGEIVVASYPKCGTTWTLQIVMLLQRRGEPFTTARDYFNSSCYMDSWPEGERKSNIIQIHFPFDKMAYSPKAKYIYVTRHPADCFVSRFHFNQSLPWLDYSTGSFDRLFDRFLEGRLAYGDFFDHLLSWYRQKDRPNVLFLTYEAIKADTRRTVLKIAEFLNYKVEDLLADDEAILSRILCLSSADSMRASVNGFFDEFLTTAPPPETSERGDTASGKHKALFFLTQLATAQNGLIRVSGRFVREGRVGDGKVALSQEQKKRLDAKMKEKLGDCDAVDLWKNW